MYKGITPTLTLTLPEDIDLTDANHVYVTLRENDSPEILPNGRLLVKPNPVKYTKTGEELTVDKNVITLELTQEETLSIRPGRLDIQVNWTYLDGSNTKRVCTDIASIIFKTNLEPGVLV